MLCNYNRMLSISVHNSKVIEDKSGHLCRIRSDHEAHVAT